MKTPQLYRIAAVTELTGLSRASIYNAIHAGTFPLPRQLGQRAVAWHEADLAEWVNDLPVANFCSEITKQN